MQTHLAGRDIAVATLTAGPSRRIGARRPAALAVLVASLLLLSGCKEENKYVPPPPPQVGVATPLQQAVRPYLEQTGNTAAFNTVNLVARVEGFLAAINYVDGSFVKAGTVLFVIEQAPYQAAFKQANAGLAGAKAQLVQSQAEFTRQSTLFRQDVTAASTLDIARAKRDSDQANVQAQSANLDTAGINLGYTQVAAPFDGVVTRHLVSVGELVGVSGNTKLATLVQLDPIYVTFNVSEQDLLRVRANLEGRRLTLEELQKVPMEVGLMDEAGFPHRGHLDYISPDIDPATGTILVRGIFDNPGRDLLPGFFVRVRVPVGPAVQAALLVPDRAIAQNQQGRYVLVVTPDDTVEQRQVQLGQLQGSLRVVMSGLKPDDRVVVSAVDRAVPGRKVAPQVTTIVATAASTAPAP